jgi:hypothetical protein
MSSDGPASRSFHSTRRPRSDGVCAIGFVGAGGSLVGMLILTLVHAWRRNPCHRDRNRRPSVCPSHSPAPGRTSARTRRERASVRSKCGTPSALVECIPDQCVSHGERRNAGGARQIRPCWRRIPRCRCRGGRMRPMQIASSTARFLFWCWIGFGSGCSMSSDNNRGLDASSCPDDERVNLRPGLTLAALCASNGSTVIVRFQSPQAVDQVLPLLEPVGGQLACDDPAALRGQPGRTCYLVRLGEDRCCSDGMAYFESLTPPASTDVPDPATPCSCETSWTLQ